MLEPIAFGPFVLDPRGKILFRDGQPLALGNRAVALLQALLAAKGEPISKSALLDAAWPDVVVEENNLTVQIAALRKALGVRPDGIEWIATLPRIGYRLQLPDGTLAAPAPTTGPGLAVLPFQNLTGEVGEDYLANGIVEDLTSALSRFRAFTVVARSSSFAKNGRAVDSREVARELGADYVLQGSVRRAGVHLRIAAQLVSTETGANLWAQSYDGQASDVFDMQDSIVESVVGVVAPEILYAEIDRARRKGAANVKAYDLYLQAMHAGLTMTALHNAEAGSLLDKALELDPDYAPALIYAAWVIEHRISMGWPGGVGDRDRMVAYAERAVAAAPTDAHILAMAAEILMVARLYDRALPLARRALEMNPNYTFVLLFAGIVMMQVGDLDQAEEALGRALRLSPRDVFGHGALSALAHVRLMRSDYEGAIVWAERSMAVNRNYGSTHWILIAANAHLGRLDEARRLLAVYRAMAPGVTLSSVRAGRPNAHPERAAFVLEGLRLAGLPET